MFFRFKPPGKHPQVGFLGSPGSSNSAFWGSLKSGPGVPSRKGEGKEVEEEKEFLSDDQD